MTATDEPRYVRWFLTAGFVGLLVALILTVLLRHDHVSPVLALVLWPTSVLGLVDPSTLTAQIITGVFTIGGNVLLYGLLGLMVRYAWMRVRRL